MNGELAADFQQQAPFHGRDDATLDTGAVFRSQCGAYWLGTVYCGNHRFDRSLWGAVLCDAGSKLPDRDRFILAKGTCGVSSLHAYMLSAGIAR